MAKGLHELSERFLAIMRSMDRLLKLSPNPLVESLNVNQLRTLIQIRNQPGISQKEVAEKLGITPASVSVAIRQMEDTSLVERRPDETDGRVMRLYLGPSGQKIVSDTEQQQIESVKELLQNLDEAQQTQLIELLELAVIQSQQNT